MSVDRKVLEKEIIYFIDLFRPGSKNKEIYEDLFKRLNDKEFFEWIEKLEQGEILALYAPNLEQPILNIKQNYKVADELGFELFQHLILTDPGTGQVYRTNNKHLVGLVPVRRQVQMLVKKISLPSSNHVVDERSGQASGDSKGSRLSGPEIQVNASKGLRNMVLELIKFRGGDEVSYNLMNQSIMETGEASLDSIMADNPSSVKANKVFSIYLKGSMLDNNLLG